MKPPAYYSRLAATTSTRANLPHWSQQCACFVTFRLADSLPQEVLAKLENAQGSDTWGSDACGSDIPVASNKEASTSSSSGQETASPPPASPPPASPPAASDDDLSILDAQEQKWLDAGLGSCVLRDPSYRRIVEAALCHFQDVRYSLYAYVVMPNHVHVLFMPHEGYDIAGILKSWKGYSAREINRRTGNAGPVWQKESWDRLVRNVDQFNAYRRYIRANNSDLAFDAYWGIDTWGSDIPVASNKEASTSSSSGQETASPSPASPSPASPTRFV